MIVCPRCDYRNPADASVCVQCGEKLTPPDKPSPGTRPLDAQAPETTGEVSRGDSFFQDGASILLDLGGSIRHTYDLQDGEAITLGRASSASTTRPTVDLSEMNGSEFGVSRLHATIHRTANELYLVDLDSTNGTYLNHHRLAPKKENLLHDGDLIRLGLFEMNIFFVS